MQRAGLTCWPNQSFRIGEGSHPCPGCWLAHPTGLAPASPLFYAGHQQGRADDRGFHWSAATAPDISPWCFAGHLLSSLVGSGAGFEPAAPAHSPVYGRAQGLVHVTLKPLGQPDQPDMAPASPCLYPSWVQSSAIRVRYVLVRRLPERGWGRHSAHAVRTRLRIRVGTGHSVQPSVRGI